MIRSIHTATMILALGAAGALAHDYTIHYQHYLVVAAPASAQGQAVVAVRARIGVLATPMQLPGQKFPPHPWNPYWAGEKTLDLAAQGDHFFGKESLAVTEMPPGHRMGPVMVQLTLTLADGSVLTLRETSARCLRTANTSSYEDFHRAAADEGRRFAATQDATETGYATVSVYRRGFDD